MELFNKILMRNLPYRLACIYIIMYTGSVLAPNPENVYPLMRTVKMWSDSLSNQLTSFSERVTSYRSISDSYMQSADGKDQKDLIKMIANDIKDLLKEKLDAVEALAKEAERIYQNYTYDPDLDIDYLNSKKLFSSEDVGYITQNSNTYMAELMQTARSLELTPDKKFNNEPVSHDNSTVHVPTNVYDRFPKILNGAYWTQKLNEQFRENERKDKSLRWQYFCSTDGFFRVFPGLKWPRDNENGIDIYDCRVRAWYLHAATRPKNILILLDSSGSMKGSRMVIARSTVKAILNTLDDDDYFNIIRFSDTIEYLDSCFTETMMPATTQNKRRLQETVDRVRANNTANFKVAFDKAYDLLNNQERMKRGGGGKLCNMAILLITDGVPEHYDRVFNHWTHNFTAITTRVFTFLIGREVDDDREVRWMACANKGYYSHISTLADVQENVQNYIKVMSRQMVIDRNRNKIWTPIYLDHMSYLDIMDLDKGLQFMTSVAIPVFDKKNETFFEGNLLGVMGTDVPIELIKQRIPVHKLGANGYAFMINHNGYVLMHPDYRPYKKIPKTKGLVLHPYYENVNLTDIALPVNRDEFEEIIKDLQNPNECGSKEIQLLSHYQNMKRMANRSYQFHHCKVHGTDFSIGIALPPASRRELYKHSKSVPDLIDKCLNNATDLELAPWFYCDDLDPTLTGIDRQNELKRLYKLYKLNRGKYKCDEDLITNLLHDTNRLEHIWGGRSPNSKDIELRFIGTSTGLTKYVSSNETVPGFILNNTNTLDALYYKRAIEGVESNPEYRFTFSVPLGKVFNPNTTLVTVSAPISKRRRVPTIFAVVGYQMKYKMLESYFNLSTSSARYRNQSCDGESVLCYLIDNHGYVMSKLVDSELAVGKFFGDVENAVMKALLDDGVYTGYNFTDYQALCDIKASETESNSAIKLLNPIKSILNGLLWTITEICMFLSEFSVRSALTSLTYVESAQNEQEECDKVLEDYDYEDLKPQERMSYNQVKLTCSSDSADKKIVGHRPCHRQFTLYKANFDRKAAEGTVKGCATDYSRCRMTDYTCTGILTECNIFYTVSLVNDTNLLLVVVSKGKGGCDYCEDAQQYDFGLAHTEINESAEEQCENRKRSEYAVLKPPKCSDFYRNETLPCGTAHARLSLSLLLLTVTLSLVGGIKLLSNH
ncbi:voltage-dependent calcium channel subunit alpha-2/delta-3-like isoform X2 [Ruditapes philippinarum]|uniref:voltage-dependent calcium channel subunit alpha-2/delta-3-like isoform X2 n=1 Tax=Ruditapes philippinarum TaxID=129788 RepID=UPI00295B9D8D|nr:voltage-dependent calcium channel subunit alpha-2/delta-3-like isoform X2 [Ruditapes philippinarum]